MFRKPLLAAAALALCASLGLASQAKAGLSMPADLDATASLASVQASAVCLPVKAAAPLSRKMKPTTVAVVTQPRVFMPLILGVAY